MENGMKILIGISVIGVLSLVIFVMALGPTAPVPQTAGVANTQAQVNLGTGLTNGQEQIVEVKALNNGAYDKSEIHVKAGQPVRFKFTAEPRAGCGMQLVIPDFGVNMVSRNGETQEATFTPQKGIYPYRCGMNMFRGKLYAD
jgi:plastocyanin